MNMLRKPSIGLIVVLTILLSFSTIFAASSIYQAQQSSIIELDDSAAASLLPATSDHLLPFDANYIGNARSHIFHYPNCRYVGRMNENNKVFFESREEAIDAGYRPCKVCQP